MNEIKVIKSPSIDYKLAIEDISKKLKKRLDDIDIANLVCDEDTVKTVKSLRSELNKEFKDYEEKRIGIKNELLKPYEEFEAVYNEKIKSQYEKADTDLKANISKVEKSLIDEKTKLLKEYFEELKNDETNFIKFEDIGLNIGISKTNASLKKQMFSFFEKVINDLTLIKTQENSERVLVKYQQCFDVSLAIVSVLNDIKRENELLEKAKAREEQERLRKESEPKTTLFTQVYAKPKEEYSMTFTVKATKEKLKSLKDFMEREGIKYE